tara:strand:- start:3 stop:248 length:246 start_codon:yes stop_codon:yes gene_type:complete
MENEKCRVCGVDANLYDDTMRAYVTRYISGVGYLCMNCMKKFDNPELHGEITIPNPTKGIKEKDEHEGEVFMHGPDAMGFL